MENIDISIDILLFGMLCVCVCGQHKSTYQKEYLIERKENVMVETELKIEKIEKICIYSPFAIIIEGKIAQ